MVVVLALDDIATQFDVLISERSPRVLNLLFFLRLGGWCGRGGSWIISLGPQVVKPLKEDLRVGGLVQLDGLEQESFCLVEIIGLDRCFGDVKTLLSVVCVHYLFTINES